VTVADQTWIPAPRSNLPDVDEKQLGDLGAMVLAATGRNITLLIGATGAEYGEGVLQLFYTCAGAARAAYVVAEAANADEAADQAPENQVLQVALEHPYVAVRRPERPEPTDNLIDEAGAVSGLTRREVADLLDVSERYLMRLRHDPDAMGWERETRLNALRTIGAALVGGLGTRRTADWLRHGEPSPLGLIREGRTDEVLELARRVRA
jgi:hypothetical protein